MSYRASTQGNPIRVLLLGTGRMGSGIARLITEKRGLELVGAFGRQRDHSGVDLGRSIGLDRDLRVPISNDLVNTIKTTKPQIAIQATCSRLADAWEEITTLVGQGVHVKVDTGMGRVGIRLEEVTSFLDRCRDFPALEVRGLMSHFPRAEEADQSYSIAQLARFRQAMEVTKGHGIKTYHMANSAAIFALADCHFDAVRPGIALYGLQPSATFAHAAARELKAVMELKTQLVFIKEVAAGVGLSYGHAFHTQRRSLIATLPIGYGDGLSRNLSGRIDVLVRGMRCHQVGRITMDMSLIDVTALRGQVQLGDEAVIIGRQGTAAISADELASKLGTINYEIVTGISHRVPRVAIVNHAE